MMTKRDSSSSSFSGIQLCFVSSTSFGFFFENSNSSFLETFLCFQKNRAYFERLVYFRLESEHLFKSDKYYIHILAIQECMEHFLRVPCSLPKKYDVQPNTEIWLVKCCRLWIRTQDTVTMTTIGRR